MSESKLYFYDAANPHNVPSGVCAAVYINGYAWPEAQIKRMHAVRRVSVLPEAYWARFASILDIERGAANPDNLIPFVQVREAHQWWDSTAYVNRSNWEDVHKLVLAARSRGHIRGPVHYWVSTLDGDVNPAGPTRAWAVQAWGRGAYDLSILHGIDLFHNP